MLTLVLLTSDFPFGSGEAFLESEMPYIAAEFDQIIIISSNENDQQTRSVPANVKTYRYGYQQSKLKILMNYFNPVCIDERKYLKRRSSFFMLKVHMSILQKAQELLVFIQQVIKDQNVDLSNVVGYSYWLDEKALSLALLKKEHAELTAISRAHRWDIYEESHPHRYLPFRHFIGNHLDAIYSISEDGASYLKQKVDSDDIDKIKISRLGINNDRKIVSVTSDTSVLKIVSCSFLIERKRVDLIMESLGCIQDVEIRWHHIGDGPLFEEIQEASERLMTSHSNIEVSLLGNLSNSSIYEYYEQENFDLFINVSTSEGIPVSIMEAFSFGIPAIATSVGGVPELVDDGYNGYLVPGDLDSSLLAEKIIDFYHQPSEEKERMRNNAWSSWNEKYNAGKNYSDFIRSIQLLKTGAV